MRLDRKWTSHLKKKEEKEEFRRLVIAAKPVLDRLKAILDKQLEESLVVSAKEDTFEMAAWAEYQASQLGEQKTYRKVIGILPKIDQA